MAEAAGLSSSYFTRMLRLSFLAPGITQAILHGRQPANLNAHKLMADTRAPIDWHEQRAGLGLVCKRAHFLAENRSFSLDFSCQESVTGFVR